MLSALFEYACIISLQTLLGNGLPSTWLLAVKRSTLHLFSSGVWGSVAQMDSMYGHTMIIHNQRVGRLSM